MEDVKFGFTAKDIINEGRVSEKDVEEIRNFVNTEKLPNFPDEQLIAFLLSCEKDQEATRKTIVEYCSIKKKSPEIFDDPDIEKADLVRQLQTLRYCVFPKRTEDGCAIIFQKFYDTNYANFELAPSMKLLVMTLDTAIYENPPTGLIILVDMKGFGMMHLTKMKLGVIKSFLHYLQEAMPVRLKCIHIFNTVYFVDKLVRICRPFIKDEVFETLHFHTPNINMEHFYTHCIPRECLPEDYGGYLPSVDILHNENRKKCSNLKAFYLAEEEERKKH